VNRSVCLALFAALAFVSCSEPDHGSSPEAIEAQVPASVPEPTTAAKTVAADAVYRNGRIYTVNQAQPWVEAVAIKDGKFLLVGSNEDIASVTGNATRVHDLAGAFAMPGLIDIHGFHGMSTENRVYCELKGTFWEPTEEQILTDLRACAEEYPTELEWFIAEGFTPSPMSKEALSLATLDEIVPDKPAYVGDESGHNAWVNSRAFEVAGVTAETRDPPAGYFERDESGALTGRVFGSAMNVFIERLPVQDLATQKLGNTKFLRQASEKGVTTIGNAYNFERHLASWQALNVEEELELHVALFQNGNFGTDELTPVADILARYEDFDLPGHPGVKIGLDGAVESGTSPMVDGYVDPSVDAILVMEPATLSAYVAELDKHGVQVKIHAIGDLAVRAAIDALEPVIRAAGSNVNRHHIDHNSHVKPEDMVRMAELGIPATIWAVLNAPVSYNMDIVRPMLSEAQWARAYPNREMLDAGVHLANHTDAPQANMWPWFGMEASVTRAYPGKPEVPPMGPDQALTLEETIRIHTVNGAWTLRLDDVTGSIEAGKSADLIVLNHNLFEIPPTDIHRTKVSETVFKGEVVYPGN
jgi:predicted amidohydrolase YtcJ